MSLRKVKISSIKLDIKQKYQSTDDKIWLLNLDQIEQHTGKVLEKEFVNYSDIGNSTHFFIKGTVLYSKLRPYLNKVVIADQDGFATTELVPIICNPNLVDSKYLAYFLRSEVFLNFATNVVAGAKMPRMVMSEFWNFEIPLPSLEEQRRISSILDKADELRQKRQQTIEKLDQLLQATFIDMFGDPVSNPKSWESCKLGNLVSIKGGGTPSRNIDEYWSGNIPWVTVKDFKENLLINGAIESITMAGVNNSATNIIPKGTLIMPTRMGLGKVALTGENVAINQDIKALFIKDKEKISQGFLLYFLLFIKNQIISLGKGATVKGITLEELNSINTIKPPLDLQENWSKIALSIEDQKQKLYKQLDIQDCLFKSLQNKAFSGTL